MPRTRTARILVQHEHSVPQYWRRFVAVLCFMNFYVTVVYAGLAIWDPDHGLFNLLAELVSVSWLQVPMLAGSFLLYLSGRGLWRHRASGKNWLWFGIAVLSLLVPCEFIAGAGESFVYFPVEYIVAGLMAASTHLILLVVMIVAARRSRPQSRLRPTTRPPWIICAAAFCFASIPAWFLGQNDAATYIGDELADTAGQPIIQYMTIGACAILLFATADKVD